MKSNSAKSPSTSKFWPVLGLAAITGSRATSGPTFLSKYLAHRPLAPGLAASPLRFLAKPGVATALRLMIAGEMVGDKLPQTEARIVPQQLGMRAASGALVGATWYKAQGGSALTGALVGGLGAAAATYITYLLRKNISEQTHTPSELVGLGEDMLVLAGGNALAR
ncbi:MAG: DUF4126 family protein [Janthinobacterium lividum]